MSLVLNNRALVSGFIIRQQLAECETWVLLLWCQSRQCKVSIKYRYFVTMPRQARRDLLQNSCLILLTYLLYRILYLKQKLTVLILLRCLICSVFVTENENVIKYIKQKKRKLM